MKASSVGAASTVVMLFAAGCSSVPDAPPNGVDTAPFTAVAPAPEKAALWEPPKPATCDVRFVSDRDAEAKARTVLATIAPDATMTFAAIRGTPATIYGMDLVLHDCATTKTPLRTTLVDFVTSHPDLFHLDPAEWDVASPTCEGMLDSEVVAWHRRSYGGHPVRSDNFAVHLRRKGTAIVLGAVIGTYLPLPTKKAVAEMTACPTLDPVVAENEARDTKYPYTVLDYCAPQGSGIYEPSSPDEFVPLEAYWEWTETPTDIAFASRQKAALRVALENHTPELIASDANCSWRGTNNIAFTLFFDAATSKPIFHHPGEGCIVCAH